MKINGLKYIMNKHKDIHVLLFQVMCSQFYVCLYGHTNTTKMRFKHQIF
jgi:hypothetical protein